MIRRFNYTQRKRIELRRVAIELYESGDDSPPSFSAEIDLSDMGLLPDALVVVIANRGQSSMRFDWGTVSNPKPPIDCSLTDIPSNPNFRVMALAPDGSGRLLALADRVKPKRGSSRNSLLWLQEADLGEQVWRLDFGDGDGNPTMQINSNIPGISAAAREDDAFRALVIPEALRLILTRALIVEEYDIDDDEGNWSEWVGFVRDFYTEEFPTTPDDDTAKAEWVEGAVQSFTEQRFHASDQYANTRGQ